MSLIAYYVQGDFPCCIREHAGLGHLCGYIGLPPCHPWYGRHYDDIPASVHGGLTLSHHERMGHPAEIARLEARVADPHTAIRWFYESELAAEKAGDGDPYPYDTGLDIWWIGFDCGHAWDISPKATFPAFYSDATYKDEAYVRREIDKLLTQAAAAARQSSNEKAVGLS